MNIFLAVLVVSTFGLTIHRMGLASRASEVFSRAHDCQRVLRDSSVDDRAKEAALRTHSVRLFGLFAIISGGSLIALLMPLSGIWILDAAGLASIQEVLTVLGRIDFLAATLFLGSGMYLWVSRGGHG